MKKERTIKELLIILRDRIKKHDNILKREYCGLCWVVWTLRHVENKIDEFEDVKLSNYIYHHRPNRDNEYGWEPGLEIPRLRWLNKRIKLEP